MESPPPPSAPVETMVDSQEVSRGFVRKQEQLSDKLDEAERTVCDILNMFDFNFEPHTWVMFSAQVLRDLNSRNRHDSRMSMRLCGRVVRKLAGAAGLEARIDTCDDLHMQAEARYEELQALYQSRRPELSPHDRLESSWRMDRIKNVMDDVNSRSDDAREHLEHWRDYLDFLNNRWPVINSMTASLSVATSQAQNIRQLVPILRELRRLWAVRALLRERVADQFYSSMLVISGTREIPARILNEQLVKFDEINDIIRGGRARELELLTSLQQICNRAQSTPKTIPDPYNNGHELDVRRLLATPQACKGMVEESNQLTQICHSVLLRIGFLKNFISNRPRAINA